MMDFARLLHADGPNAEHAAALQLYGRFVGDWDAEITAHGADGTKHVAPGEIHFGWVLEGRAVQDVWIMPPRGERQDGLTVNETMYGTTLRVWDPALRAWRVTYLNPRTGQRDELTGRRIGGELVQIGTHADGTPIRWNFTDITRDSFRWTGVALANDGVTWTLEAEFHARRKGASMAK